MTAKKTDDDPGDQQSDKQDPGDRDKKPGASSKSDGKPDDSHLRGELKEAREEAARYRIELREAQKQGETMSMELKELRDKVESALPEQERRSKGLERENTSLKSENEKLQKELSDMQGALAQEAIEKVCRGLVESQVADDRQADALDLMKSRAKVTDPKERAFVVRFDGADHTPEGYLKVWLDVKGDVYRKATQNKGGSGSQTNLKLAEADRNDEKTKQVESPFGGIGIDPGNVDLVKKHLDEKHGF